VVCGLPEGSVLLVHLAYEYSRNHCHQPKASKGSKSYWMHAGERSSGRHLVYLVRTSKTCMQHTKPSDLLVYAHDLLFVSKINACCQKLGFSLSCLEECQNTLAK